MHFSRRGNIKELYPHLFIHNSTPMRPRKLRYGEKVKSRAWKWDTWQSMKAPWLHKNKPSVCASTRAKRVWPVEPISSWHAGPSAHSASFSYHPPQQTGLSCHRRQWASIKFLKQKRTFFSSVPCRRAFTRGRGRLLTSRCNPSLSLRSTSPFRQQQVETNLPSPSGPG